MITISTHAPRMIPSEHLSRQRAGMNGIFDHYRAVDQNGGAASARILMRIGIRFSALLGSNFARALMSVQ
jgi:hypothetical protein